MAFNARKLEIVLKEVNADLVKEGVLTERVTQDIWTKLMSNLTQGEYAMAIPIRKELQIHVRKKRQNKMYTFNKIIHRLDEILDRYIPPPILVDNTKEKKEKQGKQKQVQIKEPVETIPNLELMSDTMKAMDEESKRIHTSIRNMNVQIRRCVGNEGEVKDNKYDRIDMVPEPLTEEDPYTRIREQKKKDFDISREEYYTMQANQSVLKKTIDDQQMKIKILEESVTQLEKKNMSLTEDIESIGVEKGDKIDVYSKAEREIKFLRNELKIKERTLQLSMIERNELLDRLSSTTPNKMTNKSASRTNSGEVPRPTQLADLYSTLINTEWSDALHLLTLEMKDEKSVIQCLLEVLMDAYWFCVNTNESHKKLLTESLLNPFTRSSDAKDGDTNTLDDITKKLTTELKRSTAVDSLSMIQVQFLQTMQKTKRKLYDDKTSRKLTPYIDKCVELCWFMENQDPPVMLDNKPPKTGDEFDRDAYRYHTKTGSKVDFLVLPALYMGEDGYLLLQGVAQPKQEGIALRIASSNSTRSYNI